MEEKHASGLTNILVTGGTGRLGRSLVDKLVEEGNIVKALVLGKEEIRDLTPGVIPILGTLNDPHVLNDACKGADVVFHLAAAFGASRASTEELLRVNVEGTDRLLEPCIKNGVKHFIFTSTANVYGKRRKDDLTEESDTRPTDKYGYSKMLAEKVIIESGVPYTILRLGHIYGPGYENSYFKLFRALKEGKVAIIGTGRNRLSPVHVDDVIEALMLIKDKNGVSKNKIYNLVDDEHITQEAFIKISANALGIDMPDRHVSELLVRMIARQRDLDSEELRFLTADRMVDSSRIEKELGYKKQVTIQEGIEKMVKDFLKKSNSE